MNWLTPWTGAIAAAVALPLLVLLYFLKLRRHEAPVSSTLLWRRAVQDLQVNAPFQRLRRNLLLLLQLLALAAVLVAIGGPILAMRGGGGKRYVLLIDRSASMNAAEAGGTRLAEAKDKARQFIETLREAGAFSLTGQSDQAMVIAFSDRAKVLCNFTSDKRQLRSAVEAISPTDGASRLAEAVKVAQAFAQSPGEATNNRSATERARLVLFSDGGIADLDELAVAAGEVAFYRVGAASDNVGISTMQARRSFERPEEVNVFVTLVNWGPTEAACELQLAVDDNIRAVRPVRVPARVAAEKDSPARPGRVSVSFAMAHPGGGVVSVRKTSPDALACDDAAWTILDPPRRVRVLLVTAGNIALSKAFGACPLGRFDEVTGEEFQRMAPARFTGPDRYDLVVLDGIAPAKLPRGAYVAFGRPPAASGATGAEREDPQIIVDWLAKHPLLQHVNLDNLYATRSYKLSLPREARVLAEFADSPALVMVRKGGSVFLLVAMDVMETNWPFDAGFVMFCYNAANFLGREMDLWQQASLRVGEAVAVRAGGPGASGKVRGPGVAETDLRADASGVLRFAATDRAGVYVLTPAGRAPRAFAVNLSDPRESNIAPREQIVLAGRQVQGQTGAPGQSNRPVWPILAAAALALAMLEWIVYNSKVRL